MTAYLIFAGVLALAAVVFLVLLLREGRPREATGWAGVGMSVALLCASIAVGVMATRPAPDLRTFPTPSATPDLSDAPEVEKPAAPLDFRLLAGERTSSLADFRGRVVVLNFWATWCMPCLVELPALDRLQETYGPLGLQVITLSDEDPETLRAFDRLPQHAAVAYLGSVEAALPFYRRGIDFRPVTYVIDREGVVRRVDLGARTFEHFEEQVQTWLQPNMAAR